MVDLFQRTNTIPHIKNFMWLSYVGLATAFYYYFSKFFLAHLVIYVVLKFSLFLITNLQLYFNHFLKKKIKLHFNQLLTNKFLAKSYIQNSHSAVEPHVHVDQPYFLKFIYFTIW